MLTAGYQLEKEAFRLLSTICETENPLKLIKATLEKLDKIKEKPLFISENFLEETANETLLVDNEVKQFSIPYLPEISKTTGKPTKIFRSQAKNIETAIEVVADPTNDVCSTGSMDEYLKYFQDRFKRTRRLLRQRMDCRNAASIKDAFRMPPRSRIKIHCMVAEKRETENGVFLEIEDMETKATVLIPRNASNQLLEKTKMLLPDQVVCLGLLKGRKSLLIVKELFFPDIPQNPPHKTKEAVNVALISDLHVGSREFMREEFNRFLLWINGKYGDARLREVASLVKYVIIAGDIVDGVGVYPNQVKELVVQDIFGQYKLASKFVEQIPDYIELIIVPGNHDASRRALPQPAISKDYLEPLYDVRNMLSLGNPAAISIHGTRFLIYHGRSLDDVLAIAPNMNFHSPERAMRLLLKGRHLAPTYGQRTPIAPEKRDFLVIEEAPDIFHAGHIHVMKYGFYRRTLMVNSGAWQRQTSFQRNLGLEPTPGIVPVVNLQTLSVYPIDFNS